MDSGIYLLQADNVLVRMNETPYEAEVLLQELLEDHPDLLAGDQIDTRSPRRWLLLAREAGIPGSHEGGDQWSLDHLFIDQDAIPTFVEVKRASDTRSRREVVAQMLDYAANATEHWPVEKMRALLERRVTLAGSTSEIEMSEVLDADSDVEAFWARAHANLREGRIRMLFVADKIKPELQRIVEFLNRQMSPAEVLAVEIKQFTSMKDQSLKTLVPRVIGQTEQERAAKSAGRPKPESMTIDRTAFLSESPGGLIALLTQIIEAAEYAGLIFTNFKRTGTNASVAMSAPGVPGAPLTLSYEWLWVSLGRHHPTLKEPTVNQQLRAAIFNLSPTTRSAQDERKTEVGIRLDQIDRSREDHLRALFDAMYQGLTS